MNANQREQLKVRLLEVLDELEKQPQVGRSYPPNLLPFADEMKQIREYIEVGEYGLAYESSVGAIEMFPFVLSGKAAISLLELGLLLGFKSDQKEDSMFDRRQFPN